MGSFRETGRKSLENIGEKSGTSLEIGAEMLEQSDEIRGILDGIEVQDSEDAEALAETGEGYQESFDGAFEEEPESLGQEVQEEGRELSRDYGEELGHVEDGAARLERAEGVSDIGRSAAESGRRRLEESAGEYEQIVEESAEISKENAQEIGDMKRALEQMF